jgi:hypothetical protein
MPNGIVVAICISSTKGGEMQSVSEVEAIAGAGLKGDRYCTGEGSFNKDEAGKRQVTLINSLFFEDSGFVYTDVRRNIVTNGIELMWLIGRDPFKIGDATMRALKYCDPCLRPNKLAGIKYSFQDAFFDRGGIIAEILEGGIIRVNDDVIPPKKGY